jgi:hypothetical protein
MAGGSGGSRARLWRSMSGSSVWAPGHEDRRSMSGSSVWTPDHGSRLAGWRWKVCPVHREVIRWSVLDPPGWSRSVRTFDALGKPLARLPGRWRSAGTIRRAEPLQPTMSSSSVPRVRASIRTAGHAGFSNRHSLPPPEERTGRQKEIAAQPVAARLVAGPGRPVGASARVWTENSPSLRGAGPPGEI